MTSLAMGPPEHYRGVGTLVAEEERKTGMGLRGFMAFPPIHAPVADAVPMACLAWVARPIVLMGGRAREGDVDLPAVAVGEGTAASSSDTPLQINIARRGLL